MPILSAFIVGLLFKGVRGDAASIAIAFGVVFYALLLTYPPTFMPSWFHYIDAMVLTLVACIVVALLLNKLMGGETERAEA
jgi:SSS family solute:Na+ symporter